MARGCHHHRSRSGLSPRQTGERASADRPTSTWHTTGSTLPIPLTHKEQKMDMKSKLSTLWIFVSLNYLYCDVASLMDPELLPQYLRGNVHGLQFSPMFLLSAGILVEIFIAMVLLSKVLPYRANRWANIAAGTVMTAIQLATLFFGVPAPYYAFFSTIEIATTAFIVWYAWNWTEAAVAPSMTPPAPAD
jgi:Family of unknown function (DUF6326)